MCRYPVGIEWSEERHWRCNNNAHPSRHGTYDGITMHPFETVFVKASWHVGEPHLSHYTRCALCLTPIILLQPDTMRHSVMQVFASWLASLKYIIIGYAAPEEQR